MNNSDRTGLELVHRVLPPRAGNPGKAPTLLLIHGRGADQFDLLSLADQLDPRLLVLSVRAPFPLGPGYHWYDLTEIGEPEPHSFATSFASLRRFITTAVASHNIDPNRVFLLGFSQGAVMSSAVLLTEPSTSAGTVLLSGYLPLRSGLAIDEAALRGQPVFLAHGACDSVIPVEFGRESRHYLTKVGADLTYREYPIAHQIGAVELADISRWLTNRIDAASGEVGSERLETSH
ncbi:MAG: alpha/beta hydrolase [Chloroflexota bacterium]|nr:alpha/beta hydrolase [Chloroflexota bacterium]